MLRLREYFSCQLNPSQLTFFCTIHTHSTNTHSTRTYSTLPSRAKPLRFLYEGLGPHTLQLYTDVFGSTHTASGVSSTVSGGGVDTSLLNTGMYYCCAITNFGACEPMYFLPIRDGSRFLFYSTNCKIYALDPLTAGVNSGKNGCVHEDGGKLAIFEQIDQDEQVCTVCSVSVSCCLLVCAASCFSAVRWYSHACTVLVVLSIHLVENVLRLHFLLSFCFFFSAPGQRETHRGTQRHPRLNIPRDFLQLRARRHPGRNQRLVLVVQVPKMRR